MSSGQARIDFIKKTAPIAKFVLERYGDGILPETMVTQAILESTGNVNGVWLPGASKLAREANNFWGLIAGSSWKGDTIDMVDTGEGRTLTFRKYPSPEAAAMDYVKFLGTNRYSKVREGKTPYVQFMELQKAGFASDPNYATKLASIYNALKPTFVAATGKSYTQSDTSGSTASSGNNTVTSGGAIPAIAMGLAALFFIPKLFK